MAKTRTGHQVVESNVKFIIVFGLTLLPVSSALPHQTTTFDTSLSLNVSHSLQNEGLTPTIISLIGMFTFILSGILLFVTIRRRLVSNAERNRRHPMERGNIDNDHENPALTETSTNDVTDGDSENQPFSDVTFESTYALATRELSQYTLRSESRAVDEEACRLSMIVCDPPLRNSGWNWTPHSDTCRIEPQYLRTLNVHLADLKRPLENYVVDAGYLTETHRTWKHRRLQKLIAKTSKHMCYVLNNSDLLGGQANESELIQQVTFETLEPLSQAPIKIFEDDSISMDAGASAKNSSCLKASNISKTRRHRSRRSSNLVEINNPQSERNNTQGQKNPTNGRNNTIEDENNIHGAKNDICQKGNITVRSENATNMKRGGNTHLGVSDIVETIQQTLSAFKSKILGIKSVLDVLPAPSLFESSSVLTERYRCLVEMIRDKCDITLALLSIADEDIQQFLAIRINSIQS